MADYITDPTEIQDWVDKPLVFGSGCGQGSGFTYNRAFYGDFGTSNFSSVYYDVRCFEKFNHEHRLIGLILDDTHDDESMKIAILGSDSLAITGEQIHYQAKDISMMGDVNKDGEIWTSEVPYTPIYGTQNPRPSGTLRCYIQGEPIRYPQTNSIDDPIDYQFKWYSDPDLSYSAFGNRYNFGSVGGTLCRVDSSLAVTSTLTRDENTTFVMGEPFTSDWYCAVDSLEPDELLQGNLLEWLYNQYALMYGLWGTTLPLTPPIAFYEPPVLICRNHCFGLRYFNIILTKDKAQALRYLDDGTIPSDAKLLPLDTDNMPGYDPEDGADEPGEDGTQGDDVEDTPNIVPSFGPQSITNNNLYWLQVGQLESFITWFWTQAGKIAELDDLIEKIKGLYNNLGEAVINIRYMPIDISWCGGASAVNSIIVGMIEQTQAVQKINKAMPGERNLGTVTCPQKYGGKFTDYAPYTNVMLYLPYHGYLDLDANMVSGCPITIKAIYDIMSGTILYTIFVTRGGATFLINTVLAKMAVDIPITLQSKADRDSALFSNVSNAVGSLISAGVSASAGNPVGLVMSTSAVAQSGTQSPPMNLKGTVGESGAFYASPYPALYVKRPVYNRPAKYPESVGYPCNKGYKLSNAKVKGYFTVYNPHIDFKRSVKPLQSEVDEIYALLEGGVYK